MWAIFLGNSVTGGPAGQGHYDRSLSRGDSRYAVLTAQSLRQTHMRKDTGKLNLITN